MIFKSVKQTLEMIKFSHSIFALPFALTALFYASHGLPSLKNLFLIILAMITARTTAMCFNRLVDSQMDAKNPRTQTRHIPQGLLSQRFVIFFMLLSAVSFVIVSYFFNKTTLYLSPLALGIICFYSLTKRFTPYTQIFLGFALGISPIATWIAIRENISLFSILLGIAILFWVAGFDLIYACQDYKFDKENKVKSMVVKLGIPKALLLSKAFHSITIITLVILGFLHQMGWVYFMGLAIILMAFVYEHSLVKAHDLSKVNAAFFTVNGFIGILFFITSVTDLFLN